MALVDEDGQLAVVGKSVGYWLDEDDFIFSGEDHWDDSILEVGSHVFPRDWPDVYDESEALKCLLKKTGPCASKRVSVVPNLGHEHRGLVEGVELRWLQSWANAERIKQHTGLAIVEGWAIFDLLEDVTGAAFVAERYFWNATKDGEWLDFSPRPENVQQLLLAEGLAGGAPARRPAAALTRRQQALAQHLLKRRCPKAVTAAAKEAARKAAVGVRGTEVDKLPPAVPTSARSEEVRDVVRKVKLGVLEPVYALLKQVPGDADFCEALVSGGMCAALAGQLCNKKHAPGVVKLLLALLVSAKEGGFGGEAARSLVAEDGVELALQLLTSKDSELVANVALALGHVCFRHEPAQTRAGHAGAVGQVVRLLGRTEDCVAPEAAYLLWHMLVGHRSNTTAAFAEGACKALVGLLSPEADSKAATNAAGALMQLANAPGAQEEMAQIGAIPALSLLLQREQVPRARGLAAGALMNATDGHEANARQAMAQSGTMEGLVSLLRQEGGGAAREYAAGAVANLTAFGGPNAPSAAVAAGAVEALLAFLLVAGSRDAEVFAALANLSRHIPEDRLGLFEGRLLERLLAPLQDREDPSRQQALGLCMNIAIHVPVKLRLVRAGFAKVVVELLEDADEALRELAAGALANLMEGHAETVANVFLQAPDLHKKLVYVLETEYSKVIQKPMARAVALLAGRHREVVRRAGAVEPLCDIIDESSAWEAVLGLMNIAPVGKERHELVKRGTVKALVKLLTEGLGSCRYYAVGALANTLAGSAEAAGQAIAAGAIPAVAGILRELGDEVARMKAKPMKEVPPLLRLDGPFSKDQPGELGEVDPFSPENGQTPPALLGGAFSLSARVSMTGFAAWARIFDFSVGPDCDAITAGCTAVPGELHFSVFKGSELLTSLVLPGGLVLGAEATYLFTVSGRGRLRIYRDGTLLGEKAGELPAPRVPRPHLRLAGHHHWPEQGFHGMVAAVSVWDDEVEWQASSPWQLREASHWAAGAVGLLAEYGDHRACAELVEEAGGVLPPLVKLLDGARTDVAELAIFALGALAEGREREVYEALEGKKKRLQEVVALLPMGLLRERARFLVKLAR